MTVNPTAFRDAERINNSDRNAQVFKEREQVYYRRKA